MMVWVYQLLWLIAPCFLKGHLRKKSDLSNHYLEHWDERFGHPYLNSVCHCIWIHAVSVGETQAAESIINLLKEQYPNTPFLITQMTPTGRAIAKTLYPFAQCRYLPYDKKSYVQQFLHDHQPKIALFMETEIWPNFFLQLKKQHIPTFLLNARLSKKSCSRYIWIKKSISFVIQCPTKIFAQSAKDLHYFRQLGAKNIEVTGNSKYDISITSTSIDMARYFQAQLRNTAKKIVVCGSTRIKNHVNEAYLLLDEWHKHQHAALLVIVPRHPEACQLVYDYAVNLGFITYKRSGCPQLLADAEVIIGDSMGELNSYYLCADIVFVGGSLVDQGCHNIIEPIRCGVPVIFGYSTYNFEQICQDSVDAQCAVQVNTVQEWYKKIQEILNDGLLYQTMQENAKKFITNNQGASMKMVSQMIQIVESNRSL